MHDTITGPVFQEMLIFGAASIAKEKQSINDLNVFPVPDGDTGTNMSLTMHAAAQELQKRSPATVDLASSITASALLRGARGNSGVILSLLFRGMSKSLKGCVTADGCTFAAAMQEGVSAAYNAVMKPAEGTILTVSRLAADRAMAASAEKNSVEYVIEQAIAQGEETLRQTVDMNPVLKKAGVVDAGGKGFLVILKGMLAALRGEAMPTLETEHAARDKADFASVGDEDITFAFDTVFIVRRIDDRSIEPFREFLNSIGDSLVIGEDDEAFKVPRSHRHPGRRAHRGAEIRHARACQDREYAHAGRGSCRGPQGAEHRRSGGGRPRPCRSCTAAAGAQALRLPRRVRGRRPRRRVR